MLIQRGYRRRLASKHGEYATKEEFEQLVTFQAKTLPTVLGEWKRLHEQAQGSSGAGPVERSSSDQVIPTPSHLLDRISPIFPPFFLFFCAFSPPRRDGSNEPQAGTQGQETVARAPKHRFAGLS